jgi:D-alanyl-D-alanine carboxypeptidase
MTGLSILGFLFVIGVSADKVSTVTVATNPAKSTLATSPTNAQSKLVVTPVGIKKAEAKGSDEATNAKAAVTEMSYSLAVPASTLKVGAAAFLIGDVETGEVILAKNPQKEYPMASVTKLMTALVARGTLNLHSPAEVTQSALSTYGTAGDLVLGEKIILHDLLYPLLIVSSNDAAEVFAEQLAPGKFIKLMNEKAKEIGMSQSKFEDASGLTPNNISTPVDLFKLAAHIYHKDKGIYDITRVKEYSIFKHNWKNGNHFLGYANFIGGKNGYTDEALRTSVALYAMPFPDGEVRIISIIVLQTNNREQDVNTIYNFIKKNLVYNK